MTNCSGSLYCYPEPGINIDTIIAYKPFLVLEAIGGRAVHHVNQHCAKRYSRVNCELSRSSRDNGMDLMECTRSSAPHTSLRNVAISQQFLLLQKTSRRHARERRSFLSFLHHQGEEFLISQSVGHHTPGTNYRVRRVLVCLHTFHDFRMQIATPFACS